MFTVMNDFSHYICKFEVFVMGGGGGGGGGEVGVKYYLYKLMSPRQCIKQKYWVKTQP